MRITSMSIAVLLLTMSATAARAEHWQCPFQNPDLPMEERVGNVVSLMALDEKINFLTARGGAGVHRLGIPCLAMSSHPPLARAPESGPRGNHRDGGRTSLRDMVELEGGDPPQVDQRKGQRSNRQPRIG